MNPSKEVHDSRARELYLVSTFSTLQGSPGFWTSVAAILLQLAISILLLVFIKTDVFVDSWAGSSSTFRLLYVTLLTILATLITSFTTGSIRKLWFHIHAFRSNDNSLSSSSSIRVLAGLGELPDQFKGWQTSLTLVFASLITTSVVAGLTPRTVTHISKSHFGRISYAPPDTLSLHPTPDTCTNNVGNRTISGSWFSWILPDGTIIAYDQNPGPGLRDCEAGTALNFLVNAVSPGRPNKVAYLMSDVKVLQGAAGIPWGLNGLDEIFGITRNENFLWTSRCLPVLKTNPVRCYARGQIHVDDTNRLRVSDGQCTVTQNLAVRPGKDNAIVKGACTRDHALGTATIVFGATNRVVSFQNATYGTPEYVTSEDFADVLAAAANSDHFTSDTTFAAACEVDFTQVVEYRMLNYSRADGFGKQESIGTDSVHFKELRANDGYGYQVQAISNSSCDMRGSSEMPIPLTNFLTDAALATAAGATWPLLAENMFFDGWFDTIAYVVSQLNSYNASGEEGSLRRPTFSDSTNNLEDALGLATAITIGLFWGGGVTSTRGYMLTARGAQAYLRVRLGPNSLWGLLYLMPPLFAIGILIYLLVIAQNGGREGRSNNSRPDGKFRSVPQEEEGYPPSYTIR